MANSEDPDEMPLNATFHHGLHCLLRQNQDSEKEMDRFIVILTCNPLDIKWKKHAYILLVHGQYVWDNSSECEGLNNKV